jgi:succinoglycan biosynthesis transport protein ExoP
MIDKDLRDRLDKTEDASRIADASAAGPASRSFQGFIPNSGHTPHLRDYLKILSKRRWLAGGAFLIVALGTAVYNYTATSIYEARVKLLIEAGEPNYVSFKEVVQETTASADYYQTQYDLLKSRSLARKTIESLKLWNGVPSTRSRTVMGELSAGLGWIGSLFHNEKKTTSAGEDSVAADAMRESRAIDSVLATINVSPVRNSRIVNLTVESRDPRLAMQVANVHARGYIEQNTEFKFLTAKEATDWLTDRLAEQKQQVANAEAALQRYREQHDVIPAEDSQNIVVQKLTQLNAALTTAKTNRLAKEAIYTQLKAVQGDPTAVDAFPDVVRNESIQTKRDQLTTLKRQEQDLVQVRKLGPTHPEVEKVHRDIASLESQLQTEIAAVVRLVRSEYESALAQEKNLTDALEGQKREALTMSKESIQFGQLQREADSTRQIYQNLLAQAKETGVSNQLRTTNVRIIDLAEEPRSPSRPDRLFNMAAGLLSGLLLGVSLAFFIEYLDNRIKTPDEIKIHLGLPPLGLLPMVRNSDSKSGYPLLSDASSVKLTEAFRTFRTNVLFSSAETGSRSLMITSTGPSEGKTLVSGNLAVSLAEAGLRVLLVDADMRRPKQNDVFGVTSEPGLSDLLVGNAKASESVRKTSFAGLWILPAGRIPPNPAELLGSNRFDEFLRSLREHFDWVLIDTPPVMAVADASIVAHKVTGVVFVVGADMVSRHAAVTALEQLENAQAKLIGGVLNRVDLDRHAYYYSQYYRKEYAEYYTRPAS